MFYQWQLTSESPQSFEIWEQHMLWVSSARQKITLHEKWTVLVPVLLHLETKKTEAALDINDS